MVTVKHVVPNPMVLSTLIGMLWSVLGLRMPGRSPIGILANALTPCALFAIGLGLSIGGLRANLGEASTRIAVRSESPLRGGLSEKGGRVGPLTPEKIRYFWGERASRTVYISHRLCIANTGRRPQSSSPIRAYRRQWRHWKKSQGIRSFGQLSTNCLR